MGKPTTPGVYEEDNSEKGSVPEELKQAQYGFSILPEWENVWDIQPYTYVEDDFRVSIRMVRSLGLILSITNVMEEFYMNKGCDQMYIVLIVD